MSIQVMWRANSGACFARPGIGRRTKPAIITTLRPSFGDVFEFLDRFGRRMHRHACGRRDAIGVFAENVGVIIVERAARDSPQFVIPICDREEPLTRIEHGEVEAHLVEPAVEQLWHRGGRAVVGVFRRIGPPHRTRQAKFAPLLGRRVIPAEVKGRIGRSLVTLEHRAAAGIANVVEQRGFELDDVTVRVDYRMADAFANFGRIELRVACCYSSR